MSVFFEKLLEENNSLYNLKLQRKKFWPWADQMLLEVSVADQNALWRLSQFLKENHKICSEEFYSVTTPFWKPGTLMLRNSSCIVVKIRWTPAWRTTEPYANWSTPRGLSIIWSNKSWSLLCAAAFLLQWKYIQNWTKDVTENTSKEHEYGAYSLNSLTSRVFPISLIYIPKDMIQIFSFQRKGKIDVSMWHPGTR